jgi:N-acetylneuraminic acid mutarotase
MMGLRSSGPAFAILLLCVLPLQASAPVATGTWQQGSVLSTVRTGATATLMPDGRVLIVGGKDGNGIALATAEVFKLDGTTAPVPSMLTPRYGHSALLLNNGSVLVAGGHTTGGAVVNTAELFDPIANTWRPAENAMVDSRAEFTLSQLLDGSVLVVGGDNGSGPISSVEQFIPLTGAFQYAGSLNAARKAHAAAVLNDGRVLIVGGSAVAPDAQKSLSPRQRFTIQIQSPSARAPRSTSGVLLIRRPRSLIARFCWLAETTAAPTSPRWRSMIRLRILSRFPPHRF